MTTTENGDLTLTSVTDPSCKLIVRDNKYSVELIAKARWRGDRVSVVLEGRELDALAAEILRIREERSI